MYLGIDLGTSAVKTILVDDEQRVVASRSRSLTVASPHPGYSEQDPGQWIDAAFATLDALRADHPGELAVVDGIGLSGQMHGATLLDANLEPLRPCILWNDGRSAAECRMLEQRWPALRATTGNKAMPGYRSQTVGVARTNRDLRVPDSYCCRKLSAFDATGEAIEDVSDASGSLWLDVAAVVGRGWPDRLSRNRCRVWSRLCRTARLRTRARWE